MNIQVDSREQKNQEIIDYFNLVNQPFFISKVAGGDYLDFENPKVVIDLKSGLLELSNNLTRKHQQFLNEINIVHNQMKCEFVVLIREDIHCLENVKNWKSKRTKLSGEVLYKIMNTMQDKYKIRWLFCNRKNAGERIISILEGRY